jgi:ATP-dependent DNA helicase DinG
MDLDAAFASLPGLTRRQVQRTMASAVATALEREQPLLVHAPTGVGKSLGYLVPIAAAGQRAIVATATKALQSQLVDRDLPRLADAFQTTSALLMGRGNYLCLAAETRVITSAGVREIAALAGSFHELLGGDGRWVKAEVRSFGVQRLMRLTLTRNGVEKVIHATGDHRWFVRPGRDGRGRVERTTSSLRPGQKLQSVFPRPIASQLRPSPDGIAQGVVAADGTPFGRAPDGCRFERAAWTVVSVEPTDRVEEVYCAVVPTTGSFALEDNILTGNCLAKADALVAATRLAATAQEEAALELVDWAVDSETGSRLEAPPGTRDDVWDLVSTAGEDCPGQKGCSFFKRCFAERAREQARDVDVVVTNHHLLLLELELRQASESPGVMLPEVDVVVVDEAHRLADHAADLYGVTVTGARVSRAGAAADAIIKASGSTSDWARRLRARWEDRASGLRAGPVLPGSRAAAELGMALEPILREAQAATTALRGIAAVPDDLEGGLHAARRRLTGLSRDLQRLREVEAPVSAAVGAADRASEDPDEPSPAVDLAVWVEERRDGGRTIRSALVEPGEVLRELLWDRIPATVACSATLAVAGELEGTAATLGVERPDGLVAESPFDFRSNALLYVPRGVPAPAGDGFQAAAEREARALIEASEGRALVLCTSWRAVESFAAALTDLPWELLVQGDDTPARLAARFRDEVASVLVATRTFFEGVDVPGQSLSLLVLDRLPFPRPDDPLLAERGRRIERRGGSKFGEVWLPSAAVSLQQALGRLIRSETDRGVMAVLDRRLADAGYGRRLLVSLPPAPLTRSIQDVRRFFGTGDPRR